MRIALFTRLPTVLTGLAAIVREAGHEFAGAVTTEGPPRRYGDVPLSTLLEARPPGTDLLVADGPSRFAALLATLEPDLALCGGFPVRIPADALAVPRLGVLNGHPAPLPRYRGPNPIGWALRNGDREAGFSFHLMAAEIDTGPVLVRGAAPVDTAERSDEVIAVLQGLWRSLLPQALALVEAGERGQPQSEDEASYAGFFDAAYVELDWTRPAEEVHRQVRAWFVATTRDGRHGPLTELDGERVRVLRTRLDDRDGGTPVECGDGRPLWVVEVEPA